MGLQVCRSYRAVVVTKNKFNMADAEKVKFAFDIFDFDGKGEVDAFYIGDLLRAVDLDPSEKSVSQFGVPEKKGGKMIKITDFMPMYQTIKKEKGKGSYEDFVECMKLMTNKRMAP